MTDVLADMTDTLEDHKGTVGIRGRKITHMRFADDVNGLAGKVLEFLSNKVQTLYDCQLGEFWCLL